MLHDTSGCLEINYFYCVLNIDFRCYLLLQLVESWKSFAQQNRFKQFSFVTIQFCSLAKLSNQIYLHR